jgi:hypothetical protein
MFYTTLSLFTHRSLRVPVQRYMARNRAMMLQKHDSKDGVSVSG